MPTNREFPDDLTTTYDVGGYNALLSLSVANQIQPKATWTGEEVEELLAEAREIIVETAAEEGRDLSPYLHTVDEVVEGVQAEAGL